MKRQKVRGKKRSGGVSIDVCDINLFITEFHASYSVSPKLFSSILLHAHGGYLLSLSRSEILFLLSLSMHPPVSAIWWTRRRRSCHTEETYSQFLRSSPPTYINITHSSSKYLQGEPLFLLSLLLSTLSFSLTLW